MTKYFLSLLFLIASLLFSSNSFAQDTLVVPSMINGEFHGALNQIINGDTLSNGDRKNLNRVYKLNRDETYFLSGTIFADYPLRIVAEKADDGHRPAIITSGVGPNGSVVGNDFFTCSNDVTMENFYIMGTPPTNIGQVNRVYFIIGEDTKIRFNNVTFEWGQWLAIGIFSANTDVEIRNCYFKNQHNTSDPFNGRAIDFRDFPAKKLIFVNNTLFNANAYLVRAEYSVIDTVVIEHNSVINALKWPLQWRYETNARIANNLFYNSHSYAETSDDRFDQDLDGLNYGIINLEEMPEDVLDDINLQEKDRSIQFTNNNWFFSQEIKDYWAEFSLDGEPYMNSRTLGFINSNSYPNITETNTTNIDPLFANGVEAESLMVGFMNKKRRNQGSLPWGFDADGIRSSLTWPRIENLAITNDQLLTGGDDGYPIGDLNWYPGQRENWEVDVRLGVEKEYLDSKISLVKAFPNPISKGVNIQYDLIEAGNVNISIVDREGRVIHHIALENQQTGKYIQILDMDSLEIPTGTYYYLIRSGNSRRAGSLLFIK